jgi:acetate kinase
VIGPGPADVSAAVVLVINAGSASLKLRLLGPDDEPLSSRTVGADDDWSAALEEFLGAAPTPDLAGHRVVHGGDRFVEPAAADADLERSLAELEELAPLHNPPAIAMIRELRRLRPQLEAFACFDTAFHRDLPPAAATYALPAAWRERWPLHRFGFHGLSHSYASRRAAEILRQPATELRLVTAHLGAGASLAAVVGGRSIDTTMGFTPLEGLVMATRAGSVDPGLLLWVQRHGDLDATSVEAALERQSGLLGISQRSGSMSELLQAAGAGDEQCALAIEVYLHRLRAAIAAMVAAMEGLDALVFTGGVGEGSAEIRERTCAGLGFLGLKINGAVNHGLSDEDSDVSAERAAAKTLVVHAREDLEIARQVRAAAETGL